jgi:hypothetical protein
VNAVKPPTAKQAKEMAARRKALASALDGRTEANAASMSLSYAIPLSEVQSAMRSMGVTDNG